MQEAAAADARDETAAAYAARKLEELLRGTRKLDDVLQRLAERQTTTGKAAG